MVIYGSHESGHPICEIRWKVAPYVMNIREWLGYT